MQKPVDNLKTELSPAFLISRFTKKINSTMALEITGKLIQKLPEQTGVSKAGKNWVKQHFIIETVEDKFPKKVALSVFGEKVDMLRNIPDGSNLKVSINIESREWQGKWFTDVSAWRIETVSGSLSATNTSGEVRDNEPPVEMDVPANGAKDDLPF